MQVARQQHTCSYMWQHPIQEGVQGFADEQCARYGEHYQSYARYQHIWHLSHLIIAEIAACMHQCKA